MFLTLLVLVLSLAMVLAVKARFDRFPEPVRVLLIGTASVLVAVALTMEMFIYAHRRVLAFLDAVERVPWPVVLLVFLLLLYGAYVFFRLLARMDRREFGRLFRENVTPHLREMASDVREAWRKRRPWRIWGRGKGQGEGP